MKASQGQLTINLKAIQENYRLLQNKVGSACKVSAVIKANAYGLGAQEVGQCLIAAGCQTFFVSGVTEAVHLREISDDIRIIVLNGYFASTAQEYITHNLIPSLGTINEIKTFGRLAQKHGRKLPAVLHFNTRMNRLGLGQSEQQDLFNDPDLLKPLDIALIMSHLACADEPDHEINAIQNDLFSNIVRKFPNTPAALSNSSGIFLGSAFHYDLVRPGMALYGLNPTPHAHNPMHSVVSLSVPIIRVRRVFKGAKIGYGMTHEFPEDSDIATVSAGYADGIFRSLGNKGALYWSGYRCPIVGRVSMDLTSVDLSAIPQDQRPKPGDFMEVLGAHQSADDLARNAGTIGYEVLTHLGQRYERHYTAD